MLSAARCLQLGRLVTELTHDHFRKGRLHAVQKEDEAELSRVRVVENFVSYCLGCILNFKVRNQHLERFREVIGEVLGARSGLTALVLEIELLKAFHHLCYAWLPLLIHLEVFHGVRTNVFVKLGN